MATTTSTYDSGLLHSLLPEFEQQYDVRVEVIAVGTGQALEIAARGDADVVLVHALHLEEQFVREGFADARHAVMYNDFVLVGPSADPAQIRGMRVEAALLRLAETQASFASRGDDSGTHVKELALWESVGLSPGSEDGWYASMGQGMGATLLFANEQQAYTLTDRGTFLAMHARLPELAILVGGQSIAENPDEALYNPYSVMLVNPVVHPHVRAELAQKFIEWLISIPVQEQIGGYGSDRFGQPLFYPDSDAYRKSLESEP